MSLTTSRWVTAIVLAIAGQAIVMTLRPVSDTIHAKELRASQPTTSQKAGSKSLADDLLTIAHQVAMKEDMKLGRTAEDLITELGAIGTCVLVNTKRRSDKDERIVAENFRNIMREAVRHARSEKHVQIERVDVEAGLVALRCFVWPWCRSSYKG